MFRKIIAFVQSKQFIMLLLFGILFVLSLLFWFCGALIAFNDIYIFGSSYLRFGILLILWGCIFLFFFLRPIIDFVASLKSEKRAKMKSLKKEANDFLFRAKRNFFISLKDAKSTWKNEIQTKNLPLVIIIGNEGAGKNTLINYSNIEYPLSDSLESYKKLHKSTRNFALYVSKKGALLDTEGNYFSQEEFFNPTNSDELPEDDLDKNRDFLLKRNIWKNFLNFLNKNFFYSKLNGIVLVIDSSLFLNSTKEYSKNLIRHLTKRVNDCEKSLNLKLPIYIVFSKLDLMEGMREYFDIFNENIANKILGLSFGDKLDFEKLNQSFKEISDSLLCLFMENNNGIYTIEEKNKSYLFLKQLDNLFALARDFILELQEENSLKNNSHLRGIYFVSAYQENIPRNLLLDTICDKYNIKKALAKVAPIYTKKSYFVKSLLEEIIFKDYLLSSTKNFLKKFSFLVLMIAISLTTYLTSYYFLNQSNQEVAKSHNVLKSLETLLGDSTYHQLTIQEKANLLIHLKSLLGEYPELFEEERLARYLTLKLSYAGFEEVKDLYYKLNEEVLKNTLLKEMEELLITDKNKENLVKTLFMYKSLFQTEYLNKNLLKIWINENWNHLEKYQITKENFLQGVDELVNLNLKSFYENQKSIITSSSRLKEMNEIQRVYVLLNFLKSYEPKEQYFIKQNLGYSANSVLVDSPELISMDKIYTKEGMIGFLATLNKEVDDAISIESWIMESNKEKNGDNKNAVVLGILKLYLNEYQNQWNRLLLSLEPQKYNTKEAMLNQLDILSKKENPITSLISVVSKNTNINDAFLLSEAYKLGLNAGEIKTIFANLANAFEPYHRISKENSLITAGAASVGLKSNSDDIMDILSADIANIQNQIQSFSSNNLSIEEKISYALGDTKEINDPFVVFDSNIKKIPTELEAYYKKLSRYSWRFIEKHGISLFNTAWKNEVYTPFINDIAPFYPFNNDSTHDLSLDSFKSFFGKNGTLNNFYKKYFNGVLVKRKNIYSINTKI